MGLQLSSSSRASTTTLLCLTALIATSDCFPNIGLLQQQRRHLHAFGISTGSQRRNTRHTQHLLLLHGQQQKQQQDQSTPTAAPTLADQSTKTSMTSTAATVVESGDGGGAYTSPNTIRTAELNAVQFAKQKMSEQDNSGSSTTTARVGSTSQEEDAPLPKGSPSLQQQKTPSSSSSASSSVQATITATLQKSRTTLDMPWSDVQAYALRDKVSRYTVQVPGTSTSNEDTARPTMKCLVLWRNLVDDTPELAGYPLPFLVQRLQEDRMMLTQNQNLLDDDANASASHFDWQILPFLDAFAFETGGGLTGCVYGVQGVADGTRIRTPPVANVHVTVPRNFVRTADGSVLYELGQPDHTTIAQQQQQQNSYYYSLDGTSTKGWQRDGKELAASMLLSAKKRNNGNTMQQSTTTTIGGIDPELLQLGGLTAIVMGGALAMESLSHHLTVNVFWV